MTAATTANSKRLFLSTDGGDSWSSNAVGAGLPDVPLLSIEQDRTDGSTLYVGVDQRYGGISWKGTIWREIKADQFTPAVLRRGWDVLDKNNKAITVFIDCEGAVVPQLASFQEKVRTQLAPRVPDR